MRKPSTLNTIMTTAAQGPLQMLFEKMDSLQALDRLVKDYLPKPLATHCRVINFDKGRLVLAVENSSFATQLNFQKPDLLSRLRTVPRFSGLIGINHHVQPAPTVASALRRDRRGRPPRPLGPLALESLSSLAEQVQEPELQASLRTFLRHQQ